MQAMPPAFGRAVDLSALRATSERAARQPASGPASAAGQPPPAAAATTIVDVTEATFTAEVIQRSTEVPVVLDFWAEWCGPCKQLSPLLEEFAATDNGAWVLGKIDIDANPQLAAAFRVQSIPMVVAIIGGQPVDAFAGVVPKNELRQWLDAIVAAGQQAGLASLPAAADETPAGPPPQLAEAAQRSAAGDYDGAKTLLTELLAAQPDNADATVAIAKVELAQRVADIDTSVAITAADADPTAAAKAIAAADAVAHSGDLTAAFDRLLVVVKATAGDDRDAARVRLLELFQLAPPGDDRVAHARRALASALF